MSLSLNLSTNNFSEALKTNGNDEFYFAVGCKKVFCHKFVAAFLSKSILQIFCTDPTANSFKIDIQGPFPENKQNQEQIEQIIINILQKLILGQAIEITSEELKKFKEDLSNISNSSKNYDFTAKLLYSLLLLNKSLNNNEIKQQLFSYLFLIVSSNSNESIDKEKIENQIKSLHQIETFLQFFQENNEDNVILYLENYLHQEYSNFIEKVAAHFYELEESTVINLNGFVLKKVLSSSKLHVESEDSLLKVLLKRRSFILENEKNDINENFFIECIQFEYLSEKAIECFLNEIKFEEINVDIWERIKKRLILPVQIKTKNERAFSIKNNTFSYNDQNPFNGIFNYLTKISNGNIQSNKTIEMKCSKICCGSLEAIVDYSNSKGWIHVNGSPTPRWLQIDFKSRKVIIDSYVIKIYNNDDEGNSKFIKSWKLEASDDGNNWELIDQRDNVSELNGRGKMHLFNVNKKHQACHFIRIITDKDNWCSSDGFEFGKFEFFGSIIDE